MLTFQHPLYIDVEIFVLDCSFAHTCISNGHATIRIVHKNYITHDKWFCFHTWARFFNTSLLKAATDN